MYGIGIAILSQKSVIQKYKLADFKLTTVPVQNIFKTIQTK